MNTEKLDSIVYDSFKKHKISSSQVISHYTDIPDSKINESISRLVNSKKIFQSAGGLPKRYSTFADKIVKPADDTEINY
jgi:hypothetical protein